MSNLTQISDWEEWKKECAFEKCCEEAKQRFGEFCDLRLLHSSKGGSKVIFSQISKYLGITGDVDPLKKRSKVLSLIDAQFIIDKSDAQKAGKNNKVLKDWLIQQSPTLQHIEANATYFIYEVKRKILRQERGTELTNFEKGRTIDGGGLTVEDMAISDTPSPSESLKFKDLEEELYEKANFFFLGLPHDRKVAILSKSLNISFQNKIVLDTAQKGHSVLYENLKTDLKAFAQIIQKCELLENQSEDRLKQASLYILGKTSLNWAKKPENDVFDILKISND